MDLQLFAKIVDVNEIKLTWGPVTDSDRPDLPLGKLSKCLGHQMVKVHHKHLEEGMKGQWGTKNFLTFAQQLLHNTVYIHPSYDGSYYGMDSVRPSVNLYFVNLVK